MIEIQSKEQIERTRHVGSIVADVLQQMRQMAVAGVRLRTLNREATRAIRARGASPAFLGYEGFPASLCLSLNDEAVHGLPRWRKLKEGDLLSIDCGVKFDGLYADSAITVMIGNCDARTQMLVAQTRHALQAGIAACQVGNRLGDVGAAIEAVAEAAHLSVVRSYCGHGIGTSLHQDPQVPNWGPAGQGPQIEPGWCLAIEPVLTLGTPQVVTRSDNWTVATRDGQRAAHFEMMVACTEQGPQILSLTSEGKWP